MAQDWNNAIIKEFRGNGGKVGGQFAGAPLLILRTVGAKSGKPRTNPLMYLDLGHQQVAVFATRPARRRIPIGTTTLWRIRARRWNLVPRRSTSRLESR